MNKKDSVALVKVFIKGEEHPREEFLIQYSSKDYADPDKLALKIELGLNSYAGMNPDLYANVGLQANEVVGHFLESAEKKLKIKRSRTLVINLFSQ